MAENKQTVPGAGTNITRTDYLCNICERSRCIIHRRAFGRGSTMLIITVTWRRAWVRVFTDAWRRAWVRVFTDAWRRTVFTVAWRRAWVRVFTDAWRRTVFTDTWRRAWVRVFTDAWRRASLRVAQGLNLQR